MVFAVPDASAQMASSDCESPSLNPELLRQMRRFADVVGDPDPMDRVNTFTKSGGKITNIDSVEEMATALDEGLFQLALHVVNADPDQFRRLDNDRGAIARELFCREISEQRLLEAIDFALKYLFPAIGGPNIDYALDQLPEEVQFVDGAYEGIDMEDYVEMPERDPNWPVVTDMELENIMWFAAGKGFVSVLKLLVEQYGASVQQRHFEKASNNIHLEAMNWLGQFLTDDQGNPMRYEMVADENELAYFIVSDFMDDLARDPRTTGWLMRLWTTSIGPRVFLKAEQEFAERKVQPLHQQQLETAWRELKLFIASLKASSFATVDLPSCWESCSSDSDSWADDTAPQVEANGRAALRLLYGEEVMSDEDTTCIDFLRNRRIRWLDVWWKAVSEDRADVVEVLARIPSSKTFGLPELAYGLCRPATRETDWCSVQQCLDAKFKPEFMSSTMNTDSIWVQRVMSLGNVGVLDQLVRSFPQAFAGAKLCRVTLLFLACEYLDAAAVQHLVEQTLPLIGSVCRRSAQHSDEVEAASDGLQQQQQQQCSEEEKALQQDIELAIYYAIERRGLDAWPVIDLLVRTYNAKITDIHVLSAERVFELELAVRLRRLCGMDVNEVTNANNLLRQAQRARRTPLTTLSLDVMYRRLSNAVLYRITMEGLGAAFEEINDVLEYLEETHSDLFGNSQSSSSTIVILEQIRKWLSEVDTIGDEGDDDDDDGSGGGDNNEGNDDDFVEEKGGSVSGCDVYEKKSQVHVVCSV